MFQGVLAEARRFRVLRAVLRANINAHLFTGVHERCLMALTDHAIKSLKPKSVRYLITDGSGLAIEVLPSGKLSWIYRYRLNGNPEKLAIGRYPAMSLKLAQAEKR